MWSAVASPHQIRKRLRRFFSTEDPESLADVERYVTDLKSGKMTEGALFKQLLTVYGKTPGSKKDYYTFGSNGGESSNEAKGKEKVYGGEGRRLRAVSFSTVVSQRSADGSAHPEVKLSERENEDSEKEARRTITNPFARRKRRIRRLTEDQSDTYMPSARI